MSPSTPPYTLLSRSKTNNANLCLTTNPITPQPPCTSKVLTANRSSLIGPNHTKNKFSMVILLDSTISPLLFFSNATNGSPGTPFASTSSPHATSLLGGRCHCVTLGSSNPVRALNLGKRCLGQGTRWKSCGALYTKLKICGISSNKRVLLKCPRMLTMAKTMPAK